MIKVAIILVVVGASLAQHYGYEDGPEHGEYQDGGFEHNGFEHGGFDKEEHDQYHNSPSTYSFEYSVHDSKTGDYKQAKESREGDVVKGFYTLQEADGTMREVHYTADKKNGFQAEVVRSGHPTYPKQEYGHSF